MHRQQSSIEDHIPAFPRHRSPNAGDLCQDDAGKDFHYPIVEFVLPDGSIKTVQLSKGSWPPAYEKGETVTVLYDSERPLDARIKSPSGTAMRWVWSIVTGILGVAFIVIILFVRGVFQLKPSPADG